MCSATTLYSDLDDHDLVLACQKKIQAAFNALYKRYLSHAYGVLNRLAADMAQIHDDIVQEVFVRVWKSIDTLRNPHAFKRWFNRLITNVFYDELRKRTKEITVSIDEPMRGADGDEDGGSHEIPDSRTLPDESLERKELLVHINRALSTLSKNSQKVIVLRDYYGFTYEEIVVHTKSELGTVKSRIARARAKMQSHLAQLNCA